MLFTLGVEQYISLGLIPMFYSQFQQPDNTVTEHILRSVTMIKNGAESDSAMLDNDAKKRKSLQCDKKVGIDISNVVSSLKPTELLVHYITEEEKNTEDNTISQEEWEINWIKDTQAQEKLQVIEEGNLLSTSHPPGIQVRLQQIYLKEKASIQAQKKHQNLNG